MTRGEAPPRERRRRPRAIVPCLALALEVLAVDARAADSAAKVWAASDGVRVRRDDVDSPLSRGERNSLFQPGAPIHLTALRGEVVAFQIVIEAGQAPIVDVTVDLPAFVGTLDAPPPFPVVERFVEHYVEVRGRSRNDHRPLESLGWSPEARPSDAAMLGEVPDALIPVELARGFVPYPLTVRPRSTAAIWIDVTLARETAPGLRSSAAIVRAGGVEIARLPVLLDVADAELPYRPVSFLAYYGRGELADRIGESQASERQLIQLLHRHQVDAFADLRSTADVDRLESALDGSLFTAEAGYVGPGIGVAPAAVAIGAYGALGEPTRAAIEAAKTIAARIPAAVHDVVLYAVDEDCESDLGPSWKRVVHATPSLSRVTVAHSCGLDPRGQDVDLVLTPAELFDSNASREARAAGRGVWIYNGAMPRTGTLLLDAPPTGLRADGWIAATHAVGRWFLWETTFWNDDNSGGHGAIDPFVTAESFHNRHDAALLDGMLVYPGTQIGKFAAHSLGFAGVLPSMRLKSLRRGIEDAGYFALARAASPTAADAIARKLLPAVLDEIRADAAPTWPSDDAAFVEARDALRRLIAKGATLEPARTAAILGAAADARRSEVGIAWDWRWSKKRKLAALGAGLGTAFVVFGASLVARRLRRKPEEKRRSTAPS